MTTQFEVLSPSALDLVTGGFPGGPKEAWESAKRIGTAVVNIPRNIYNHGYEWGNKPGPV